ncbi:MAG: 3-methylornithyl-N6-L-lysine dehydrogenase PylD [Firmicutes bacterium HGW-Firmicutes-11]|nr:MAG: 3-methylornithyl-N6-L-lysine dehydrogenase PylD [Firmicutes bacterium HGW-Firmicutes-11]
MTRLKEQDLAVSAGAELLRFDIELERKIGASLQDISTSSNGLSLSDFENKAMGTVIAAVPVTSGLGVITGFADAVAGIISYLGFSIFVTEATDVAGIHEAGTKGVDWIFLADDDRFLGIDRMRNRMTENDKATAKGYIQILETATGGLSGKEVLILGCGRVGKEALKLLEAKGAFPVLYDKNSQKTKFFTKYKILGSPEEIKEYPLVFDATDESGWLTDEMLHPDVWIAAPGLPISLTDETLELRKDRIVHDRLPIGVAVMLGELCR